MYSYGKKDKFIKNEKITINLLKSINKNDVLINNNKQLFYIYII